MLKDPECLARYEESMHAIDSQSSLHASRRLTVSELQEDLKSLPQVEMEPVHRFAPGLYTRELFIPAHTFVIGKTHRHSHPVFFMQGKCKMWDVGAGTEPEEMQAPLIWVSVAGAKRVLYTLEDCIFATCHASDETDLEILERDLIVPETEILPHDVAGRLS